MVHHNDGAARPDRRHGRVSAEARVIPEMRYEQACEAVRSVDYDRK